MHTSHALLSSVRTLYTNSVPALPKHAVPHLPGRKSVVLQTLRADGRFVAVTPPRHAFRGIPYARAPPHSPPRHTYLLPQTCLPHVGFTLCGHAAHISRPGFAECKRDMVDEQLYCNRNQQLSIGNSQLIGCAMVAAHTHARAHARAHRQRRKRAHWCMHAFTCACTHADKHTSALIHARSHTSTHACTLARTQTNTQARSLVYARTHGRLQVCCQWDECNVNIVLEKDMYINNCTNSLPYTCQGGDNVTKGAVCTAPPVKGAEGQLETQGVSPEPQTPNPGHLACQRSASCGEM